MIPDWKQKKNNEKLGDCIFGKSLRNDFPWAFPVYENVANDFVILLLAFAALFYG